MPITPHRMLSFTTPKWRAALNPVTPSQNHLRSRLGFGHVASLIVPRLYLSNAGTARDPDVLAHLGITHVVSILDYWPSIPDIISQEHKLHISLPDTPDTDILSHLPTTTTFITSALSENEENKVLVHCAQGISRSATVVIAYLIASSGMGMDEALDFTREKRSIVCPNIGFRKQLAAYAESFVGRQTKRGATSMGKIGVDIARRIRQLTSSSQKR
ncbi:hypothetical protein H0H93_008833 [Arthromyces matolae]|nr:hypothetical protein H0H93_008833 [Arthromyces matolae]